MKTTFLVVEQRSRCLHMSLASIRGDATRNPRSLPQFAGYPAQVPAPAVEYNRGAAGWWKPQPRSRALGFNEHRVKLDRVLTGSRCR